MATLATASLSDAERRALDRFVAAVQRELGDELHAVWLYGSRARGEPPRDEDSDVDLLVVTTRPERDTPQYVRRIARDAAEAEGLEPFGHLSVVVTTPDWISERRAIEAFYIQEVDRDKIVLAGGEIEAPPDFDWHALEGRVRQRTREYLDEAGEHLRLAQAGLEIGTWNPAVVAAYDVVVDAARAVQSEADRFARSHGGTWHLVHELLVETGRMAPELHASAHALLARRMYALYGPMDANKPWTPETPESARQAVEAAERFLHAVEELVGDSTWRRSRYRAPR
jgi:predicted nucleotidyltransferase/HEPN domain-containing protein